MTTDSAICPPLQYFTCRGRYKRNLAKVREPRGTRDAHEVAVLRGKRSLSSKRWTELTPSFGDLSLDLVPIDHRLTERNRLIIEGGKETQTYAVAAAIVVEIAQLRVRH